MKTKSPAKKKTSASRTAKAVGSGRLVRPLSEDQILKLSNDLSENIASGDVKDWRSVALYFRNAADASFRDMETIRTSVAALTIGQQMTKLALPEIQAWLDRRCAQPNDQDQTAAESGSQKDKK